MLNDRNEFLKKTTQRSSGQSGFQNAFLPQSFVRITSIDTIALQPSRKISPVSEVFTRLVSSFSPLETVLSFVDECCLNQTSERSSNLKQKKSNYSLRISTNESTWIMNEIENIDCIERYTFDWHRYSLSSKRMFVQNYPYRILLTCWYIDRLFDNVIRFPLEYNIRNHYWTDLEQWNWLFERRKNRDIE